MSSTPSVRSIPKRGMILSGIAAFGIGLFAVFSGVPSPRALAQTDCSQTPNDPACSTAAIGGSGSQSACAQPSDSGCPMALDSSVQASITDPSATHTWQLNVADSTDFTVMLKNLPGDYAVAVAGPDGTALGAATDPGTQDKSVQISNVGVGTYTVTVTSQTGDVNDAPYTLIASNLAATVAVPISSYDTAPVRFSSYR